MFDAGGWCGSGSLPAVALAPERVPGRCLPPEPAVGGGVHGPAGAVGDAVVGGAEPGEVLDVGGSAVLPVVEVVEVGGGPAAAGEDAEATVAHDAGAARLAWARSLVRPSLSGLSSASTRTGSMVQSHRRVAKCSRARCWPVGFVNDHDTSGSDGQASR